MRPTEISKIAAAWMRRAGGSTRVDGLRFGQWFLNTYFPHLKAPDIFYQEKPTHALQLILCDERIVEW